MRNSGLSLLEAVVRDANPVPDPRELVDSAEAAAVTALVDQRTPLSRGNQPVRQPPRWWVRPAVVFATAFLVPLGIIGIATLVANNEPNVESTAASTMAPEPVLAGDVSDIAIAQDGSVWATTNTGVVRWDLENESAILYTTEDGLPTNDVLRIVVGSDGTVWVGHAGWVARFDGVWTTFSAPGAEGPMAVSADGSVWTAFGERALARFDGSEWRTFHAPLSLDDGIATPWTADLAVTADGTVWAGGHEYLGLWAFDGTDWTHYSTADGLPRNVGWTVAPAPDGSIWASSRRVDPTSGGGVAHFDGSTWINFTTDDGLLANTADIAVGTDGTVWAVHETGVSRFNGERWTPFSAISGHGRFAAVAADGTLWMAAPEGGLIGFDGSDVDRLAVPADAPPVQTPAVSTIVPVPSSTVALSPLPITPAQEAPPAATCPPGTSIAPGPLGQERPEPGWVGNAAAAYDRHAGRIVYVDTLGDTWGFDVCTNTWTNLRPTGAAIGDREGGLVYDVDSNKLIALGRSASIYDPDANTWTNRSTGWSWPVWDAVYDPVSGLVLAHHDGFLKGYDVDTDRWTNVAPLAEDIGALLGYSSQLDRIISFTSSGRTRTALIDPRTGEITALDAPLPPIMGGFGSLSYSRALDTAFIVSEGRMICRFDALALDWACFDTPPQVDSPYGAFAAMAGDPINNRIVLINSLFGDWGTESTADDVWAIDLDTGDWIQLLAPTLQ